MWHPRQLEREIAGKSEKWNPEDVLERSYKENQVLEKEESELTSATGS